MSTTGRNGSAAPPPGPRAGDGRQGAAGQGSLLASPALGPARPAAGLAGRGRGERRRPGRGRRLAALRRAGLAGDVRRLAGPGPGAAEARLARSREPGPPERQRRGARVHRRRLRRAPGEGAPALAPPAGAAGCPPGGHIDPGELPDEAAVRETLEETGLAVELLDAPRAARRRPARLAGRPRPGPGAWRSPSGSSWRTSRPGHQHIDLIYLARPGRSGLRPPRAAPPPGLRAEAHNPEGRPGWFTPADWRALPVSAEVDRWATAAVTTPALDNRARPHSLDPLPCPGKKTRSAASGAVKQERRRCRTATRTARARSTTCTGRR